MKRELIAPVPSLVLLVIAALLTFPAGLAVWEARVLLDESRFVATGNDVLEKPAVQEEIARGISEEFSNARNSNVESGVSRILGVSNQDLSNILNAIGGQPGKGNGDAHSSQGSLLDRIALKLLAGTPNTRGANAALAITHRQVLTAVREGFLRPEDDRITLDLNDAISQLLPANGVISAADLPPEVGKVEVIRRSDLVLLFRAARWFDARAVFLALLPLAVLATGLFLAPSWPRYCLHAGIAIVVASALWIALVKVPLQSIVVGRVLHEETARDAANAAYDVITAPLVQQMLLLLAAGVVLAVLGAVLTRRRTSFAGRERV